MKRVVLGRLFAHAVALGGWIDAVKSLGVAHHVVTFLEDLGDVRTALEALDVFTAGMIGLAILIFASMALHCCRCWAELADARKRKPDAA